MSYQEYLDSQQSSILSEGICPFCHIEIEWITVFRWGCPKCLVEFELVADEEGNVEA